MWLKLLKLRHLIRIHRHVSFSLAVLKLAGHISNYARSNVEFYVESFDDGISTSTRQSGYSRTILWR